MTRIVATLALVAALASCAGSGVDDPGATGTATTGTGVRGQALIGPMCPVMREDEPCPDRPVQTRLEIVAITSGDVVARVASDEEGRFSADLDPGRYLIRLAADAPPPGNMPQNAETEFTVVAGSYVDVTLSFDSGIR